MNPRLLLMFLLILVLGAVALPGFWALGSLDWTGQLWDAPWRLSPWPALVGSLATTVGALTLAVLPAYEVARRLAEEQRSVPAVVEVAGFLPSVVFGLLAIRYLIPFFLQLGGGFGLGPATLLLSVMVTPTLILAFLPPLVEAYGTIGEAAASLGLGLDQLRRLVLRRAMRGLRQGMAFAAMRLLGESVAAAMVLGNGVGLPGWNHPSTTLAALLVVEGSGAPPETRWARALKAVAFLLVVLSFLVERFLAGRRA